MNTLTEYFVPEWVSIAFCIVIPIPFILISLLIKKTATKIQKQAIFKIVTVFFITYLLYIAIASYLNLFNFVLFPPVVLLYTTFPYAFLLFGVIHKLKIYDNFLKNTRIEDIVKLHIFRVIGIFFILLAFYDSLPKFFAYVAGFGDVITAITSIFVVKAIKNKKTYAKKLTYVWNTFGFIDILFTAIMANVLTKISIDTGSMGVDTLAFFPFCIIPAFAPPTIMFLHWAIYQKLKRKGIVILR